jgi:CheY-like chemotaxis protein
MPTDISSGNARGGKPTADLTGPAIVLLVEDEPLIRMCAADTLYEAEFDVIEAETADEALQILKTRNDIAAVVTDIQMPGSLDGRALTRILESKNPVLPVVLMSARRQEDDSESPSRAVFLSKPYSSAQLLDALRKAMTRSTDIVRRSVRAK